MRHLKVLGMALVAAMAIVAFMSVAVSVEVPAATPITYLEQSYVEQVALVGISACLLAAIGAMTLMTGRVKKQKEKTMTNCCVSSETRDITNNPIAESPSENNTKTVGHSKRDLGNHCYIGSIDQQQPANEKVHEKRHLTFRLAEACV